MTTWQFLLLLAVPAALVACADPRDTASNDPGAPPSPSLVGVEAAHYAIVRVEDGVLFAARLGATSTACGDRVLRHECALGALELSRLDLSPDDEVLARARIADGTAIVRAKLVPAAVGHPGSAREASVLVATSIWVRRAVASTLASTRASSDAMFVLRDVHEGCDGASDRCAWLRAEPFDGGRAAHYTDLDVSLLGGALDDATKDSIARGEVLARGAGIGSRFIAATLYVPFGTPASGPMPGLPAAGAPVN